jgi:acyl-coenzyme A thioesterase 13
MSKDLHVISATATPTCSVTLEMDVLPKYGNRMDNMHGGAVAVVFDMCTTMCTGPIARKDFWWFGGVSRKLDVTYLRPVNVGSRIVIECELLQIGKRLATIRGVMRDKSDGKILAVAEHNKASIDFVQGDSKM